MIKSEIKEFLLTLFNNVWIWIALLIILLVIYALFTGKRDAIPKLFDIREIIRSYYKVFPIQIDFLYLLAVVSLLARITMLLNLNVDKTFSQIGVILSLLVSAIIGLIPIVLDKSDYIQNSTVKNLSHKQKLLYIEDIVQTGMFDILISIIDLILIFLSIGTTSKDTTSLLHSLLIFQFTGYLFISFNILIIMHKLYVVYFK